MGDIRRHCRGRCHEGDDGGKTSQGEKVDGNDSKGGRQCFIMNRNRYGGLKILCAHAFLCNFT